MPKRRGAVMFYTSPNGERADADLHDAIIAEGDEEAAVEVSREWLREQGWTEADIMALLPQVRK